MKPRLLQLRPEDEAKALARAAKRETAPKITDEHLAIAEFGVLYGWEAVRAVLSDEVSADEFAWLLDAGRRVKAREAYNSASGTFTAVASANAKKPASAFKTNAAHMLSAAKADA
jgi:hypothetical protein